MTTARAKQREVVLNLLGNSLFQLPKPTVEDTTVLDSPKVCKSYLVWQCPYKMLEGSKDVSTCHKLHLERYKIMYQAGEPRKDFEEEHLKQLKTCLEACDAKIKAANARFHANDQDDDDIDVKMGIYGEEINALIAKGNLLMALEKSVEVENYENPNKMHDDIPTQACEACGAILSKLDNDRRLADHFVGRIHLAYVQIRDRVASMEAKQENQQEIMH